MPFKIVSAFLRFSVLLCSPALFAELCTQTVAGHTSNGAQYGLEANQAYALNRHGPDGRFFLDPYFIPFLEKLKNRLLLDAGCGAAPWAIYAAEHGAHVEGIDIQGAMIEQGKRAVLEKDHLSGRVHLQVGDVSLLPFKDNYFHAAISINVGCNLPSTWLDQQKGQQVGLGPHFKEMARVLEPGETAVITAPASLGIVFTDNSISQENGIEQIRRMLQNFNSRQKKTPEAIMRALNQLTHVYRATFIFKNNQLLLVRDEKALHPGQEIWRKLPGLTVPNRAHSEDEYIHEIKNAGLILVRVLKPHFNSEKERVTYNKKHVESKLSPEYVYYNPFMIFEVQKPRAIAAASQKQG